MLVAVPAAGFLRGEARGPSWTGFTRVSGQQSCSASLAICTRWEEFDRLRRVRAPGDVARTRVDVLTGRCAPCSSRATCHRKDLRGPSFGRARTCFWSHDVRRRGGRRPNPSGSAGSTPRRGRRALRRRRAGLSSSAAAARGAGGQKNDLRIEDLCAKGMTARDDCAYCSFAVPSHTVSVGTVSVGACRDTPLRAKLNTHAASLATTAANLAPCVSATPFSRSLGWRDPSEPARVPAPYGDAPWASS